MHLRMAECNVPSRVTETLTSDLVVIISVSGAYLLYLLRIGIPNWCVHGCNLGWWSVLYHLRVTVTLSSDIVLESSCPQHISYIIEDRNPKFCVWMQLWMAECHVPFSGHFDLDL